MKQSLLPARWLLYITALPVVGLAAYSPPPPTLPANGTELGQQFREFTSLKEQEVRKVAKAKGLDVPTQVGQFFALVRSNQWSQAESLCMAFMYESRRVR